MPILKISNLTKSYNGKKILDGLSLEIENDEILTIRGKSGAGKTTLLLCILGFITLESGEIILDNQEITFLPPEKRQLAYVPQDYGLFPHLSVKDNIGFGLRVRKIGESIIEKEVRRLLEIVELPLELKMRDVRDLSGGEKQRVALARAVAIYPKLFLFDEPLSAIDVDTKISVASQLRSIIKRLHIPAIVISHDPLDAKNIADSIYLLEGGKLN